MAPEVDPELTPLPATSANRSKLWSRRDQDAQTSLSIILLRKYVFSGF